MGEEVTRDGDIADGNQGEQRAQKQNDPHDALPGKEKAPGARPGAF